MAKPAVNRAALGKAGIYIHIPFCAAICNYCNFNRGLHDDTVRQRYVGALVTDIRSLAASLDDASEFGGLEQ